MVAIPTAFASREETQVRRSKRDAENIWKLCLAFMINQGNFHADPAPYLWPLTEAAQEFEMIWRG